MGNNLEGSNLIAFKNLVNSSRVAILSFEMEGNLWSVPLYFVFFNNSLFFFSSKNSLHVNCVGEKVAVSIFEDSINLKEIKGFQGRGKLFKVKDLTLKGKVSRLYFKKYPESKNIFLKENVLGKISIYMVKFERAILTLNDPHFFRKEDITQILSEPVLQ